MHYYIKVRKLKKKKVRECTGTTIKYIYKKKLKIVNFKLYF